MDRYEMIKHRDRLSYSLMNDKEFISERFCRIRTLKRRDEKMMDACLALYIFAADDNLKDEIVKFLEELDPVKVKERLIHLYKKTIDDNMRDVKQFLLDATRITDQ